MRSGVRPPWQLRHWTVQDGLPQGSVFGVAQTPDGYLWLATFGGLARFDGTRFTVTDGRVLPTLASNRIRAMTAARDGGVWLASPGAPVVRTDGRKELAVLPARPGNDAPNALLEAGDGSLWLAGGRNFERFASGSWRTLTIPPRYTVLHALAMDDAGAVWVGADGGVFRAEGDRTIATGTQDLPSSSRVTALARDRAGRMWAGGTAGLFRFERRNGSWDAQRVTGFDANVFALAAAADGALWIGTDSGVFALGDDAMQRGAAPRLVVPAGAIDEGTVARMLVTRTGAIVAGTTDVGFAVITRRAIDLIGVEQGLADSRVHHVVGDGDGGFWVGGACAGLTHVSAAPRVPVTHQPPELGLLSPCVRGLMRDTRGALWIGQAGGALTRVSPDGRTRTWSQADGLPVTEIGPLLEDREGRVWIGSTAGVLCRIDGGERLACPIARTGGPPDKIWSLAQSPDGAVWVGQVGRLSRLDDSTTTSLTTGDGIPPAPLRVLHAASNGELWIGTYGAGIALLRGRTITSITTAQGLFDNAISGLLDDDDGRTWLLGNRGIAVMRRQDLEAVAAGTTASVDASVFGSMEGVPEGNGGHPAVARLADGRLAFATVRGLALVERDAWQRLSSLSPVIEAVRGATADSGEGTAYTVPPGGGPVEIRFTAPAISTPGDVRVRYQLVGLDPGWLDAGSERRAIYSQLSPGRYTFRLSARHASAVWGDPVDALTVRVLPHWWQTWVVRVLSTLGVAAALVALVRRRVRALEARNSALTTEMQERKRAEAEAHRHLMALAHVGRVSTAGQLTASLAHELGQPLMAISAHAEAARMLLDAPTLDQALLVECVTDVAEQAHRASEVVRRFRQLLGRGQSVTAPLDMSDVVREVMTLVDSTLRAASTQATLQLADALPSVSGDRLLLGQVVINLVVNAVDAMRALPEDQRHLVVRTAATSTRVRVSVMDQGHGIEPAIASRLFDAFASTKADGMGMGLAISRSIVEAHGGRLQARNRGGSGALFSFTLPVDLPGKVHAP